MQRAAARDRWQHTCEIISAVYAVHGVSVRASELNPIVNNDVINQRYRALWQRLMMVYHMPNSSFKDEALKRAIHGT